MICRMLLLTGRMADKIMESLASESYTAKLGENGRFILMHSVGSIPHNSEVDVPLNYADCLLFGSSEA